MPKESSSPRQFPGVMVSSTFTDLKDHRAALIEIIERNQFKSIAMEHDSAKPVDMIQSSLKMVTEGSAYVGVIGLKYGNTPLCPINNPGELSITELEFNRALELNRPILLFIMGEDHPVRKADIERDQAKQKKLDSFRERAKEIGNGSNVHRVYAVFESLEDFEDKAAHSIAALRRDFDRTETPTPPAPDNGLPKPPELYAQPPYIGSHPFLGREEQLRTLRDWASPADPYPVLLFEAIGGTGKSILTWEWTRNRAATDRKDWAGRIWYSFYERGGVMVDFCRHALAYITGRPLDDFKEKRTPELSELLLAEFRRRPWLVVLDGLERILVSYHRIDAAQLRDEEAGTSDQILNRDPCAAVHPDDDELLRTLAAAAPSKVLISSRLVPRVLVNAAGQGISGVRLERLPGLRPSDAELLFHHCGVRGDSKAIQEYLQKHCDCHPLTVGALAGVLVEDYLKARGNFDAWVDDPIGGGRLNLAELDLVKKRNHILEFAVASLPEKTRRLLAILALLAEAVDSETLEALNPHLPPKPDEVEVPTEPQVTWRWKLLSDEEKQQARVEYQAALEKRAIYERALQAWKISPELAAAPRELVKTVRDLEKRGLLQYDGPTKRYDLHPVVRGVARGKLGASETAEHGQKIVDYFSAKDHDPYEQAKTLDDVLDGIHVVRTLLQMGRYEEAYDAYRGDLANAIFFSLEAHAEALSLLRPFFPSGWTQPVENLTPRDCSLLTNDVGLCLQDLGQPLQALDVYGRALVGILEEGNWSAVCVRLSNISSTLSDLNLLAQCERCRHLALDLSSLTDVEDLFCARWHLFDFSSDIGNREVAEQIWRLLDPMGRNWRRDIYRPGDAEYDYAVFQFRLGELQPEHLTSAEQLAQVGTNRIRIRQLHRLRGTWHANQHQWAPAATSLAEAVRMARAAGIPDPWSETLLALARFQLHQLPEPRAEAERLTKLKDPAHQPLAELWLAIDDRDRAVYHALEAYRWAWADGEPYVHRYELNQSRDLLQRLGVPIPELPPYDPTKDEKLPWEDKVVAAIEKLRAEKAEREKTKAASAGG